MLILKQSTAVTLKIGPFLDNTDGSEEAGLTIAQADVRLSKNGGNFAQKNSATSCTYNENGMYSCALNATDTNTLGRLQLMVFADGVLPVPHDFMVVTANVYDTYCSTDVFDANIVSSADIDFGSTMKASIGTAVWTTPTTRALTDKVGFSLSNAGVDAIFDEAMAGHVAAGSAGLTLNNLLKIGKNKWSYTGTTFTIYDDNGSDVLYEFTLDSATTPTSRTPV